jgi:hypothetical protein
VKYVILIYHNAEAMSVWQTLSPQQQAAGLRVYEELTAELAASGELVTADALADRSLAKRVRAGQGGPIVSDGPFAEAKEELAGIYVVECDTAVRAQAIAARIPEARFGLVEVRPTMVYSRMDA